MALAHSTASASRRRLSLGALVVKGEPGLGGASDPAATLVALLARVGDFLSLYQDEVADESYLDVEHRRDGHLHIRLGRGLRPALCLIACDRLAVSVAIGTETDDVTVSFGEGSDGERPPSGAEDLTATYRRGSGDSGNIELRGLSLAGPLAVLVVGEPGTTRPCLYFWQSRLTEGA